MGYSLLKIANLTDCEIVCPMLFLRARETTRYLWDTLWYWQGGIALPWRCNLTDCEIATPWQNDGHGKTPSISQSVRLTGLLFYCNSLTSLKSRGFYFDCCCLNGDAVQLVDVTDKLIPVIARIKDSGDTCQANPGQFQSLSNVIRD